MEKANIGIVPWATKILRLKAYLLLDNKLPTSKLPTGWQTGKQYTVINVTTGTSMCKNITQE